MRCAADAYSMTRLPKHSLPATSWRCHRFSCIGLAGRKITGPRAWMPRQSATTVTPELPRPWRLVSKGPTTSIIFALRTAFGRGPGQQSRMADEDVQSVSAGHARSVEASRVEFLLDRDGIDATLIWVRRTLMIYRRALLDRRHFAHATEYRRKFVASCLGFRCWLAANGGYGRRSTTPPDLSV